MSAPSERSGRRGALLLDALIGGTLLLLLLGSCGAVCTAGLRWFRQSQAYADAQQECMKALNRLSRDLSNATKESLSWSNGTLAGTPLAYSSAPYIWFVSPQPPVSEGDKVQFSGSTGHLLWQKWMSFYVDPASNEFCASELPLTGRPVAVCNPAPLPAPSLALFMARPSPARRVWARWVKRLEFTPGLNGDSYAVKMEVEQAIDSTHSTKIALGTQITLGNL